MRIAIVSKRFDLIGGSERYAASVAQGLGERGHAVRVLCASGDQGGTVERVELAALDAERPSRTACRAITAAVREHRADLVYLLSSVAPGVFRALGAAAPLVRHVQDHTLFCPGMNKVHEDGTNCREALGARCLERYYLRGGCSGFKATGAPSLRWPITTLAACLADIERHRDAAALICASRYMREQLVVSGLDPQRVHTIPYFTRSAAAELQATPLDAALEAFLAGGEPLILCPARLTLPDKGVDYLLTALGELDTPFRCVIAGEGPAREWLEQKARDEGLCRSVFFAGWQAAGALETLYRRTQVVAFPSVWDEPFGLIGLEAGAHEKPVVAFAVGGVQDWLADGETGHAVPNRDARAFAVALDGLLREPDRAVQLGSAGAQRVTRLYSRDSHLDRLEELFGALR